MDPIRILLQTTIPYTDDDWHIQRFSRLADHLSATRGPDSTRFDVTARNLERASDGADPVLAALGDSAFDELWLFAVDVGDGLNPSECAGIDAFRRRGGGVLAARDHQDLGCSLLALPVIGTAHHFHTKNLDPRPESCQRDDTDTITIEWPNYHSGRNGDVQRISAVGPIHPLLRLARKASGVIDHIPAHPHEGGVGVPAGIEDVCLVATGRSSTTGRTFNLIVAQDPRPGSLHRGRWIAESSFHHFADYNWDTTKGAPTFVQEPPGDAIAKAPELLDDVRAYVTNAAVWLAHR